MMVTDVLFLGATSTAPHEQAYIYRKNLLCTTTTLLEIRSVDGYISY